VKGRPIVAKSLLTALIFSFVIMGCYAQVRKNQEPSGINYQVVEGAEITKVSTYMKIAQEVPWCWVDVTIRNLAEVSKKFSVIVQVDNEPEVAVTTKNPIAPKKEDTISVMTLGKGLPRTVSLTVISE
jgi:hypothetical protein